MNRYFRFDNFEKVVKFDVFSEILRGLFQAAKVHTNPDNAFKKE